MRTEATRGAFLVDLAINERVMEQTAVLAIRLARVAKFDNSGRAYDAD